MRISRGAGWKVFAQNGGVSLVGSVAKGYDGGTGSALW